MKKEILTGVLCALVVAGPAFAGGFGHGHSSGSGSDPLTANGWTPGSGSGTIAIADTTGLFQVTNASGQPILVISPEQDPYSAAGAFSVYDPAFDPTDIDAVLTYNGAAVANPSFWLLNALDTDGNIVSSIRISGDGTVTIGGDFILDDGGILAQSPKTKGQVTLNADGTTAATVTVLSGSICLIQDETAAVTEPAHSVTTTTLTIVNNAVNKGHVIDYHCL